MNDELIIAYLLEELTEEESERFEDECFARESRPAELNPVEEDLMEVHLRGVEEDLIEDYLRGDLAPERRRRFERNYLTTAARLERVRLAAARLRHVDERGAAEEPSGAKAAEEPARVAAPEVGRKPPGWFRSFLTGQAWAPAAALTLALVAALAGAWWLTRPAPRQNVATLALAISDGDRAGGAEAATVKLPPDAGALRLSLTLPELPPPAQGYRAELEGAGGVEKTFAATTHDARTVLVEIPASKLGPGQYALKLFAVQAGGAEQRIRGSYFFTVE